MVASGGAGRGFTLVEVLAATLLGAMVILAAVAALRTVAKSRTRANAHSELSGNGRYALGQMRDDLANTYRGGESTTLRFVGQQHGSSGPGSGRLLFQAVLSEAQDASQDAGDLYELEYGLSETGQAAGGVLWRRCRAVNTGGQSDAEVSVRRIAEYVNKLEFAYFDGERWRQQWQEQEELPLLVRVRLQLSDPARDTALELSQVIAPAAQVGRRDGPSRGGADRGKGEASVEDQL